MDRRRDYDGFLIVTFVTTSIDLSSTWVSSTHPWVVSPSVGDPRDDSTFDRDGKIDRSLRYLSVEVIVNTGLVRSSCPFGTLLYLTTPSYLNISVSHTHLTLPDRPSETDRDGVGVVW